MSGNKKVAFWIKPKHRLNVKLIENVYKASDGKSSISGWKWREGSDRISVYEKNGEYKIVFKGTTNSKDIIDDVYLSFGAESSVELVKEGNVLVKSLLESGVDKDRISLTGHSLGGYAANVVGKSNTISSVTFNAAAPPTAPILRVNKDSTNYHIVGDIISSHVTDDEGLVIRANKNTNFFSSLWNHGLDRFYDEPTFSFWDAGMENALFKRDKLLVNKTTPISIGNIFDFLKDIPNAKQKGFQLYFQDLKPVSKKEIVSAWKGVPLNSYNPSAYDEEAVMEAEKVKIPLQSTYIENLKRRITADDIAFKRHNRQFFEYEKSLKSSLAELKKNAHVPILWRTRKEYNSTMRGRVVQKPSEYSTAF